MAVGQTPTSGKLSQTPHGSASIDEKDGTKIAGTITIGECERLVRLLDETFLPAVCRQQLDRDARLRKACVGMSPSDASAVVSSRKTGSLTGYQLQRRWTSRENPLAGRKEQLKKAEEVVRQMEAKGKDESGRA